VQTTPEVMTPRLTTLEARVRDYSALAFERHDLRWTQHRVGKFAASGGSSSLVRLGASGTGLSLALIGQLAQVRGLQQDIRSGRETRSILIVESRQVRAIEIEHAQ
jgi:hypothetical protein